MPLHLIKLCVGVDTLSDLADWQAQRLKDMRRKKQTPELMHITRQTPRRDEEILSGGSLYWVIKGHVAARQKLKELRPVTRDGIAHCGLVYDATLVRVVPRPHRPFQGWRYLAAKDAPKDLGPYSAGQEFPEALMRDLAVMGLL